MNQFVVNREFPDCFPQDFKERILPEEAKPEEREVYRVCKWGVIDDRTFLSTFEEIEQKLIPPKKRNIDDPGLYSTSCNMEREEAEQFLAICNQYHPEGIIIKGNTIPSEGVSQLTRERNPRDKSTHVDWWIYKDARPHKYFTED